jgi:hypothetical protein
MPKLDFDPKFSIGNVVTVALLLVSLVGGWFNLTNGVGTNAKEILSVSQRVTVLESSLSDLIRQLGQDKVDQTRILTQLQTDMSYTRAAVEELRATARGQ